MEAPCSAWPEAKDSTQDESPTARGAVGDYGGNHGDLTPGAYGLATDLYFGGNGTGVIVSSRAICENGKPINWIDRVLHRHVTDGLSNTLMVGESVAEQDPHSFAYGSEGDWASCNVQFNYFRHGIGSCEIEMH